MSPSANVMDIGSLGWYHILETTCPYGTWAMSELTAVTNILPGLHSNNCLAIAHQHAPPAQVVLQVLGC